MCSPNVTLIVNGIVGQADIWVNGTEVASQTQTEGDYAKFTFNITPEMVTGTNSVAFEVYPNDPYVMYTVDNVDWTQNPVDNNTGIQFPVQPGTLGDGPGTAHGKLALVQLEPGFRRIRSCLD